MDRHRARTGRANTLGLHTDQLEGLLEEMDESGSDGSARREHVRWPFRHETIHVRAQHPGGADTVIKVACRNLSRGGISLIHSSFMHPGTRCTIALPHPTKDYTIVAGVVTRCTHRRGNIHEIGVHFDTPINIREYLDLDPFGDSFSLEHVEPSSLVGCMLHVHGSELDRRIVQHFLRDTQLRIRGAADVEEGLGIAKEGVDIILCDCMLGSGETGAEFVSQLRVIGVPTPALIATSDICALTRERMADLEADGFLAKPFDQTKLLRAIGEFLVVQEGKGEVRSSLYEDEAARPLIREFVDGLRDAARKLRESEVNDDAEGARVVCLQLRGTAPSIGFEQIGRLAEAATQALAATMSINESRGELHALITACDRAQGD